MKKPGSTIFSRFLLASAIPFALVFALALLIVMNIVVGTHRSRVTEKVTFFADQATEKIDDNIQYSYNLLRLASRSIADVVENSENGRKSIEETLHTFMNSNPEVNCAWFVFKPRVADDSDHWYTKTFLKKGGLISEIPPIPQDRLNDPGRTPWHVVPYNSSVAYFNMLHQWDYGIGESKEYVATVGYPVVKNGMIIGTVGMDILYENAFRFMSRWEVPNERKVFLISAKGDVVASHKGELRGKTIANLGFDQYDRIAIIEKMEAGERFLREMHSPFFNETSLVHIVPVISSDPEHTLFLYLDSPTSFLYSNLGSLVWQLCLVFLLGLAVLVATAFLATATVVRPLMRIAGFAEDIASGNLDVAPDQLDPDGKGGREVVTLARSIRKMLGHMHQNHQLKLVAVEAEFEKKKAEDASRARTQFFANMSHELRTPMHAIVGISDILLAENLEEKHLKYVNDIKTSSESLLVIIDDILDISRMETGKLRLVESNFSLYRMLANIADMASYLAAGRGLVFEMVREEGVPEYLYADEVRIRQILLNLLGNAVKFTAEGSVRLRIGAGNGRLFFEVSDTGIGIRDEDRQDLFNAFRQVDATKNSRIKGAGLGLSITMNLARLMEGDIELESEYGAGSTFRVVLPLVQGEAETAPHPDEQPEAAISPSARILVVDDNDINLKVAAGVLGLYGLKPDVASSGGKALEMVAAAHYDLIFMDHMMPEMDGAEATRRIREMDGRAAATPIVAFTANTVSGAKHTFYEAGMNDFLAKPIKKLELQKILAKWIPAHDKKQKTVIRARPTGDVDPVAMAKKIDGLDVTVGMANAGGEQAGYLEALRLGREAIAESLEALDSVGNSEHLVQLFHVVGKTLRDIGATGLAAEIEKFTDGNDSRREELMEALESLRKLDSSLRELPL